MVGMETKTVWLIGGGIGLLLLAFLPTPYNHRSLLPTENPRYIRRVYDNHTVEQTFQSRFPIESIRVLLRGSTGPKIIHAAVADQSLEVATKLTANDTWVTLKLPHQIPAGDYRLSLSAPEITEQQDAILVRFQVDSTNYEGGFMIVDGKESYGDIAFSLSENIPAWKHIPRYFSTHPQHGLALLKTFFLGTLFAVTAYFLPSKGKWWWVVLAGFVILAFLIRWPTLVRIDGVFGGDAFNYLSKANAWLKGNDPFSAEARKGPLMALILLPITLTPDPIFWSRALGAFFAAVAGIVMVLTLRRLKVPSALALLGGALLVVNREFWWESLNGLANVPYATIIAASTLAFVSDSAGATGTLSALSTLTRYEGLLVTAIYVPALWIRQKFKLQTLRPLLVPTLILLALPFIFWPLSGSLGVRTISDVRDDGGLYIAWDWHDYTTNLQRLKSYVNNLWFTPSELPLSTLNLLINISALAGGLLLIKKHPKIGVPIILMAILQAALITYILPKTRYYIQLIPVFVLLVTYAVSYLPRRLAVGVLGVLVAGVYLNSTTQVPILLEDYNNRGQADSVLMQAAKVLRKSHARAAFATNFFAVETYLPRTQTAFDPPENLDEQLAWLKEKNVEYIVETDQRPFFDELIAAHPEKVELTQSFRSISGDAHSQMYRVKF